VSDYPALEDRAGPDVSLHIGSRSRQHPHSTAHRRASSRSREPAPDSNRPTTAAGGGSYAAPQATSMVAGVVATFLHLSRAAVDAATNHLAPRKDRHLGGSRVQDPGDPFPTAVPHPKQSQSGGRDSEHRTPRVRLRRSQPVSHQPNLHPDMQLRARPGRVPGQTLPSMRDAA
jgi:hypothetical protein